MSKRLRQYIGLVVAMLAYYLVHEGAHLIYALSITTFQRIRLNGLGMQIAVYAEKMNNKQLWIFCVVGSVSTLLVGYLLVALADQIGTCTSKVFKACMYYITIAMLLLDPLYLSVLCGFFGGGDMNGISLLIPETVARMGYGMLFIVNSLIFSKIVLPKYQRAFTQPMDESKSEHPHM